MSYCKNFQIILNHFKNILKHLKPMWKCFRIVQVFTQKVAPASMQWNYCYIKNSDIIVKNYSSWC